MFPQLFARSGENRVIECKWLVIDQCIGRCVGSSPVTIDPLVSYRFCFFARSVLHAFIVVLTSKLVFVAAHCIN